MIKVHLPVAETLPSSSRSNVVDTNGGRGVIFDVVSLVTPPSPQSDLRGLLALSRAFFPSDVSHNSRAYRTTSGTL